MSKIIQGASVLCYINNQLFAEVSAATWNSSTPRAALHTIDWLPPVELMQQSAQVSGSLSVYRLRRSGGIQAAGLAATFADLTKEKYFSILLVDRVTDTTIFRADNCSVTGEQWHITKGLVQGEIGFDGLSWSNEVKASTPE